MYLGFSHGSQKPVANKRLNMKYCDMYDTIWPSEFERKHAPLKGQITNYT